MLNSFFVAADGLLAGGEFDSAPSLFPVLGIATRGLIYSVGEAVTWREIVRLASTINRTLSLNSYYGEGD